jgi:CRISPR type IV-associated protein Csf2
MITFEAIAAGVPMYFKLVIGPDMSDAQIGLMAQSVCNMVNDQRLGGWCRAGLGSYDAMLQMRRNGMVAPLLVRDDTDETYVLSPDMAPYIDAMREALFKITAPEIGAFYAHRATADDAPAKTKAAKKAAA